MIKTLDAEVGTFALAATIGIINKMIVPPFFYMVDDEVMNDAVAERRGKNLTDDWTAVYKGDTARRAVGAIEDIFVELLEVF